jgi:hypothetical protein
MIRRILLPAVLPAYVVALRSGLGLGWMFVVAAEFMCIAPRRGSTNRCSMVRPPAAWCPRRCGSLALRLVGLQCQPELLAYHPGQEAAHPNGPASRSPASWPQWSRHAAGSAAPAPRRAWTWHVYCGGQSALPVSPVIGPTAALRLSDHGATLSPPLAGFQAAPLDAAAARPRSAPTWSRRASGRS